MDNGTVYCRFKASVDLHGARSFLHAPAETASVYNLQKTNYSYAEADKTVDALICAYRSSGAGPGVRIGLAYENRPEFFLHFLAINAIGASIVPLNCAMQDEELQFQIAHSACALIVGTKEHCRRLENIIENITRPPPIVEPGALSRTFIVRAGVNDEPHSAGLYAEAALLYTSGTTGKPKGCILSNDYFRAIGDHYTSLGGLCAFEEGCERIITPLPVTHMNALACSFMAAMQTGGCLVQLDRFHPRSWWRTVRESRATVMHYLGVMPAILLKAPETAGDNVGDQVKFAFGAGCDPRHHAEFERRFGAPLIEAWAMTETGAGAWITASEEPRHVGARCFGRPPAGLEFILIDEEGNEVRRGEPGELLVRRAGGNPRRHFFSGYFRDSEATEQAWRGGWFHTGDVVRVGEDGSFYFVDRRKNVIRRSGENISAIEVESVLLRLEGVKSCVAVAAPDELRGEEVAILVQQTMVRADEVFAKELFSAVMDRLVYYKAPGYIAFVDAIPMTASEKINRREAKKTALLLIERGDYFDFRDHKKPLRVKTA